MLFVLGGWRFRTDPAENARGNVPYLCTCQSCRNFLAAVETLPGETQAFFRRLGLRVAFLRRMPPMVGDVQMDAFFHLPFVLDEPWED